MNVEEGDDNHHDTDNSKNIITLTESEEYLLKKRMSQSNERLSETKSNHLERNSIRNSLRRSKFGLSDTFIPERFQNKNRLSDLSEQTSLSLNDLRKSFTCSNTDISKHDYIEIDYGFDKENKHNANNENSKKINSKHKHVLDTSEHREQNHKTAEEIVESSVQTLKNLSQDIPFNRNNTYQSVKKHVNKTDCHEKKTSKPSVSVPKDKYYFGLCQSKDIRSDTDLSVKKLSRPLSGSCGEIQKVSVYSESKLVEPAINSALLYDKKKILTDCNKQNISRTAAQISEKTASKARSNSLLCKGKECKTETEKGLERRGTLKKRSLSFLQRVWKKKEKKQEEQDYETVDYETIPPVIHKLPPRPPPSSKVEPKKPSPIEIRTTIVHHQNAPEEPSPDYDTSFTEDIEKPPELPPRHKERPPSPWHDIPKNNAPIVPQVEKEVPPALPAKTINRSLARRHDDNDMYMLKHHHEWTLKQDHTLCYQSETTVKVNDVKKLTDIDVLLAELSEINFLATNEINKPCTWKTTCSVMDYYSVSRVLCSDAHFVDSQCPSCPHTLHESAEVDMESPQNVHHCIKRG